MGGETKCKVAGCHEEACIASTLCSEHEEDMRELGHNLKDWCVICLRPLKENMARYISRGNFCAECNARSDYVRRAQLTTKEADWEIIEARRKNVRHWRKIGRWNESLGVIRLNNTL